MSGLEIRPAGAAEFAAAVEWAAREGWNPGLDDLAAFHAADPGGFLMGFVDGEPVSSISVVRYGDDFGFLGFYIVHPDRRGTGIGMETWNAGMARLQGRTVGLDGVVAQQDNYRRSGFEPAGRNIRHAGVPDRAVPETVCAIRPATPGDMERLAAYDRAHFPADRAGFLRGWTLPGSGARRMALVAAAGGAVFGYGTIRECRSGWKIGPLFADARDVAEALFAALVATTPAGAEVSLDTPQDNAQAVEMALRAGLEPVFETARMYRGPAPRLPLDRIYGVTTFELG
ncbi:MAG: GNAT family N-acetyltransferase [Oricola sp.]